MRINKKEAAGERYLELQGNAHNELVEKMLQKNHFESVMVPIIMETDSKTIWKYLITGKESVRAFHERRRMMAGEIISIMEQLLQQINALEEYLISPGSVLIDPEYMFFSEDGKLEICCRPDEDSDVNHSLERLVAFFMKWMTPGSTLETKRVYWIYESVQKENATLRQVLECSVEPEFVERELDSVCIPKEKKRPRLFWKRETAERGSVWQKDPEGEENGEETVVLSPELLKEREVVHHLKRIGKEMREDIPIYSYPAFVGKNERMDIRITVPTISGRHAQFQKTGEEVTLRDMGSLNGTYVNDIRILEPVAVWEGDRIRFADQEYYFE